LAVGSTELRPQRNGNDRWGCGYPQPIQRLRADRWRVELIYLALLRVELSHRRLAERVPNGGRNIPAEGIDRRLPSSQRNL